MHDGVLRHLRGPANGIIVLKAKTGKELTREMEKTDRASLQVCRCIRTYILQFQLYKHTIHWQVTYFAGCHGSTRKKV